MVRLVTDYLDESARRFPDKAAVVDSKRSMTFGELKNEAQHIASDLIGRGLFRKPVAILLDKSGECLAGFMGVAYSGNFYTPLDTEMPDARIEKILQTLEPSVILTDRAHEATARKFETEDTDVAIYEELMENTVEEEKIQDALSRTIDTDIVYILFTSGSTGIPKGVIIPHKGVITYAEWAAKAFQNDENMVLANQTPFYFSMSIFDIFQTLRCGGTMYIIPKMYFSFPIKLLDFLAEKKINTIYWVPSALCFVANLGALGKRDISCVKKILFAGEVMPAKQLNMWRRALPDAFYANLFGPTEVTDICNYYVVEREISDTESVPIGGACENTGILILNEKDEEVTGTEIGELCIRGSSLAYGYYKNPEKTAAAFVQNPVNKNYPEIIYRTGDLVQYNEAGELLYCSRKDFQIKHMGYRIELGEIETAVSSVDGVMQNCCLYDTDKSEIVLFYTGNVDEKSLIKAVRGLVPNYMVPNKVNKLPVMPLNLNGKIDRTKLKASL